MVLVVLVDSFCTCRDIDSRAGGGQPPDAIWILTDTCLALYCLEMIVPYHLHSGSLCVVVVVVAGAGGGGEHTHSITESDAMWAPVPSQPQFLTWGYSA
jgi:hypothetical protein